MSVAQGDFHGALDRVDGQIAHVHARGNIRDPREFLSSVKKRVPDHVFLGGFDPSTVECHRLADASALYVIDRLTSGTGTREPGLEFVIYLSGNDKARDALLACGLQGQKDDAEHVLVAFMVEENPFDAAALAETVQGVAPDLEILEKSDGSFARSGRFRSHVCTESCMAALASRAWLELQS